MFLLAAVMLVSACTGSQPPVAGQAGPDPAAPGQTGAAGDEAPAPPVSLKVGYLNVMDDAQAILAKEAGLYAARGLDVELVLFSSGTDLIKAIVGGQLQAGVLGFTNAVAWVEKGADLKVVGGAQIGYHAIVVRRDSGIQSVADLRGKRLATQKQGTTADIVLNGVVLQQAGLERADVQMVYVDPAAAIQSLAAGQVDAAFVFEPYEQISRVTSGTESIYEIGKVWPFPCMVVITSGEQLRQDRDAIYRLLDAQQDAINMLEQQPSQAAAHLVRHFIPDEEIQGPDGKVRAVDLVRQAIETQTFRSDLSAQDIGRMEEIVDIMVSQGLLSRKVDVESFLDLSWQQQAGAARPDGSAPSGA